MGYVDRGYEGLHHKLRQLGARIERTKEQGQASPLPAISGRPGGDVDGREA
jgi:hypothetical protein